jgi:hypothetical protein
MLFFKGGFLMKSFKLFTCVLNAALFSALLPIQPSFAQVSDLNIKQGKVFEHKESGIVFPAIIGGHERRSGKSYHQDGLNISMQYNPLDESEFLSLYVYRASSGVVPIWFDRAYDAILNRPSFGVASAVASPESFTPPKQTVASGLQTLFELSNGPYKATGLMLFQHGEWYIKVRATSKSRSPDELKKWMSTALEDVKFPKSDMVTPAAEPIKECEKDIVVSDNAKPLANNQESAMMDSVIAGLMGATDNLPTKDTAAVTWCRDKGFGGSAYRANNSLNSYLFAVGDSGNAIKAGMSIMGMEMEKDGKAASPKYYVSLVLMDKVVNYAPRDALPSPTLLFDIVNKEPSISTSTTWGKNRAILINQK